MTQVEFSKIAKSFNLLVVRHDKKRRWYMVKEEGECSNTHSVVLDLSDTELKFLSDKLIEERIVKALTNSLW